jgi:hypothetical protein
MTPIIIKFGTEGQLRECQFKSSLNWKEKKVTPAQYSKEHQ